MRFLKTVVFASLIAVTALACSSADASDKNKWVEIKNDSSNSIVRFYASHVSRTDWGADLIPTNTIRPGYNQRINIHPETDHCRYDFKAVMSDGSKVVRTDINVCTIDTWTVFDSEGDE
jgi:hypothetical protein